MRESLKKQDKSVLLDFDQKVKDVLTFFAEQSLNACLYYEVGLVTLITFPGFLQQTSPTDYVSMMAID